MFALFFIQTYFQVWQTAKPKNHFALKRLKSIPRPTLSSLQHHQQQPVKICLTKPQTIVSQQKDAGDYACSYLSVNNHVGRVIIWVHDAHGPRGEQRSRRGRLGDLLRFFSPFVRFSLLHGARLLLLLFLLLLPSFLLLLLLLLLLCLSHLSLTVAFPVC